MCQWMYGDCHYGLRSQIVSLYEGLRVWWRTPKGAMHNIYTHDTQSTQILAVVYDYLVMTALVVIKWVC